MSQVTVNHGAINRFFAIRPLGGTGFAGGGGTGSARVLAQRMATQARQNASGGVVRSRSGILAQSVRPIVRETPIGVEIGVGTTVEYGGFLERGVPGQHIIAPRRIDRLLASAPGHPDPLRGPRRFVIHPGIPAKHWLRQAVDSVIGRRF